MIHRPPAQPTARPAAKAVAARASAPLRRGFSLIELVVVLAISLLLTGLLMPAMSAIKENAHRIVCSSNQRQMGVAFHTYYNDNDDRLPRTRHLPRDAESTLPHPEELMAANTGEGGLEGWDGTGLLYFRRYCDHPGCFYCPSHKGRHTEEHYISQGLWNRDLEGADHEPIYTNYHYGGDVSWGINPVPRRLHVDSEMVLLTDGLRTKADFNHSSGMNVVRADGSVEWIEDNDPRGTVYDSLPDDESFSDAELVSYQTLWQVVEAASKGQ